MPVPDSIFPAATASLVSSLARSSQVFDFADWLNDAGSAASAFKKSSPASGPPPLAALASFRSDAWRLTEVTRMQPGTELPETRGIRERYVHGYPVTGRAPRASDRPWQ